MMTRKRLKQDLRYDLIGGLSQIELLHLSHWVEEPYPLRPYVYTAVTGAQFLYFLEYLTISPFKMFTKRQAFQQNQSA
jgi:hypothetical protein